MRNKIIKLFLERSYAPQDIPKRFFLAINFSMWDDNITTKIDSLLKGELVGVKGIAGSGLKEMVKNWGGMRELMISMPSEALLSLNKLSRVMYDNPEYLVSDGMKALRRLFNEDNEKYSSLFSKMQGYVLRVMDDPKIKGWIDYNGSFSKLDDYVKEFKNIKDVKDLVNFIMSRMDDSNGILKAKGFEWWRKTIMAGLKNMGQLYKSESEWLVKGGSLKIPPGSKIYVVEPSYYKEAYDKMIDANGDKTKMWGVDMKNVEKYKRWVELVDKIKTKWDVEIVPEQWVEKKKLELIRASRNETN